MQHIVQLMLDNEGVHMDTLVVFDRCLLARADLDEAVMLCRVYIVLQWLRNAGHQNAIKYEGRIRHDLAAGMSASQAFELYSQRVGRVQPQD